MSRRVYGVKNDDQLQPISDRISDAIRQGVTKDTVRQLANVLRHSVRITRKGLTVSGRGIGDVLYYMAPRLPLRDSTALRATYGDLSRDALAEEVARSATRASAVVGGATGAVASMGQFVPPTWIALPFEILIETLLISGIELRMIAELHSVYDIPTGNTPEARADTLLAFWSERKGVDVTTLGSAGPALTARGARTQLVRAVRKRIIARAARNVSTLIPLFVGAVLGAEINRRSTDSLSRAVLRELRARAPREQ